MSQAAAKLMLKNGSGRIIALVGNSYYENWPNYTPHTIAKTGLAKLMQSLAITLSPNIQCNAICPASIYPSESEKDQSESLIKEKDAKFQEDFTIINTNTNFDASGIKIHKGSAKEVAELVVYLSGCSNYLNGAVIPIDGGKYTI